MNSHYPATVEFTQLPADSEAKVLSLMLPHEREEYRRRQAAYRIEQRRLQELAACEAARITKEEKNKAAKQRQAANQAARAAANQALRYARSGKASKK